MTVTAPIDLRSRRPQRVTAVVPDLEPFERAALRAAAYEVPPHVVVTNVATDIPMLRPTTPIASGPDAAAPAIDDVEHSGSWVMVAGLATLERYRAATMALTLPVQRAAAAAGERVASLDLIAFLGAPDSRVPFHCDKAHHLLLQVEGTKRLQIAWYDDPEVEEDLLVASVGRRRTNPDRPPDRTEEVVLAPGDAVVIPAFCFHGVEASPEASFALAGVVRTDVTESTVARLRAARRP